MVPDIIEANAELDSLGQRELLSRGRKIKIAVRKKREDLLVEDKEAVAPKTATSGSDSQHFPSATEKQ